MLKAALDQLHEGQQLSAADTAPGFLASLLNSKEASSRLTLTFHRPAAVIQTGSVENETAIKTGLAFDVRIVLPKQCFHAKDFLNYRYHAKRVLYLIAVKRHLAGLDWVKEVLWSAFQGDPCKPELVLIPKDEYCCSLRIVTGIEERVFDLKKLRPERSNLRWMKNKEGGPLPTPRYNASILEDVLLPAATPIRSSSTPQINPATVTAVDGDEVPEEACKEEASYEDPGRADAVTAFVKDCLARVPPLRDAILLLKIWASQRWYADSAPAPDSFSGFHLSLVACHLATAEGGARLGAHMTPFQMFRVMMDCISTGKLLQSGIVLEAPSQPAQGAGQKLVESTMAASSPDQRMEGAGLGPSNSASNSDSNASSRRDKAGRLAALKRVHDVVICDWSCTINFAFRISKSALAELKMDAGITLKALGVPRVAWATQHPIVCAFLTRCGPAARFDTLVRVGCGAAAAAAVPSPAAAAAAVEREGNGAAVENEAAGASEPRCAALAPGQGRHPDQWRKRETKAERVAQQALTERAVLVRVIRQGVPATGPNGAFDIEAGVLDWSSLPVRLGVVLSPSPETAFRLVDKGPSPESKEAARKFRAFWGGKAELRRWKDGSVTECVAWEECRGERHLTVPRLLHYALARHLCASDSEVHLPVSATGGQLDLVLRDSSRQSDKGPIDPLSTFPQLHAAYQRLCGLLRKLPSLPLTVLSVHILSPALTHTALFPPQPLQPPSSVAGLQFSDPVEIAIQLEASGSWPLQPEAVAQTQLAFCLHIACCLRNEHGASVLAAQGAVDVILDGFAFRLNVLPPPIPSHAHLPPQTRVALRRKALAESGMRDLESETAHRSLIHHLSLTLPCMAVCCRLAKRWLGAHLLSGQIPEHAVELVVAASLLFSAVLPRPASPITAFHRFLRFLASTDWPTTPVLIDPNGDLQCAQIGTAQSAFQSRTRSTEGTRQEAGRPARGVPLQLQPLMHSNATTQEECSMCLVTPYDHSGTVWTSSKPSKTAVTRLRRFALSSADALASLLETCETKQVLWKSLFCSPLGSSFDALLVLSPSAMLPPSRALLRCERVLQATVPGFSPSSAAKCISVESHFMAAISGLPDAATADLVSCGAVIGFNPVQTLGQQLERQFGESAAFWWDEYGGNDGIGITWKGPMSTKAKERGERGTADPNRKEGKSGSERGSAAVELAPQELLLKMKGLAGDLVKCCIQLKPALLVL